MLEFFRDTLYDHYAILVILCIFFILASIGYLVTQKIEENKKKAQQPLTPPQTGQAQQ